MKVYLIHLELRIIAQEALKQARLKKKWHGEFLSLLRATSIACVWRYVEVEPLATFN